MVFDETIGDETFNSRVNRVKAFARCLAPRADAQGTRIGPKVDESLTSFGDNAQPA